MKRILISVLLSMLVITSCSTNQQVLDGNEKNALLPENNAEKYSQTQVLDSNNPDGERILVNKKNTETILYFDNYDANATEAMFDTICSYPSPDESKIASFVKAYLQKRGIYKETPDNVTYYSNKQVQAEYYVDKEKRIICFVVHIWSNTTDSKTNKPIKLDSVGCTMLSFDDLKQMGSLTYDCDQNQNTIYESLFDTSGKQVTNISYEYISNIPFPFITKYEIIEGDKKFVDDVLNRGQKLWFYKDKAEFDQLGKWIGYHGDIYEPNNYNNDFTCSYNEKGNLIKIMSTNTNADYESESDKIRSSESSEYRDEVAKWDYTNEITLSYGKNNLLETAEYMRPSPIYGTTDSVGEILYDEQGRMVYNEFYITHGTIYCFYLYNGQERRPWANICLDSMPHSGGEEGGIEYVYGNSVYGYIFQTD